MKIDRTFIAIVIVIFMVNGYTLTYGGFSFAASSNSTQSQSTTSSSSSPLYSTGGTYQCTNTDKYLWDHTYGKTDHSGQKIRLKDNGGCITVTGTVYSSSSGTTDEPDGDLHFTLQLDPQYEKYSNQFDPPCIPHPAGSPACKNIIVEVICHNKIDPSYINKFGPYCNGVNTVFPGQPHQGDKLSVSGRWVQDLDETILPPEKPHAPWNEIHPASYIKKLS
jgi:hypothetical protein